MKVIFATSLIFVLFLGFLLMIWVASPRLSPTPAKQRLKRSIAGGIAAVIFAISSFLVFGLFSEGKYTFTFSLAAIQGLCSILFFLIALGTVSAVYIFYQTQYSERMLRNGLDGAVKLFERNREKTEDKTKES